MLSLQEIMAKLAGPVLEMVEKNRARLRMCKEGLLQERRMP